LPANVSQVTIKELLQSPLGGTCMFSKLLRSTLAICTLIAGMTPPAMRHSHGQSTDLDRALEGVDATQANSAHRPINGQASHSHHHAAVNSQHGRHDHSHRPISSGEISATFDHYHAWFLGWTLTWPVSERSHPKDNNESQDPPYIGVITSISSVSALSGLPNLRAVISIDAKPAGWHVAAIQQFRSLKRHAVPLCDTARHERSGVQLL
jgi:hypothetical protein